MEVEEQRFSRAAMESLDKSLTEVHKSVQADVREIENTRGCASGAFSYEIEFSFYFMPGCIASHTAVCTTGCTAGTVQPVVDFPLSFRVSVENHEVSPSDNFWPVGEARSCFAFP